MTVTDSERRCVTPGLLFTGNGSELISRRFLLIAVELHSSVTKTGEERSSADKAEGSDGALASQSSGLEQVTPPPCSHQLLRRSEKGPPRPLPLWERSHHAPAHLVSF